LLEVIEADFITNHDEIFASAIDCQEHLRAVKKLKFDLELENNNLCEILNENKKI